MVSGEQIESIVPIYPEIVSENAVEIMKEKYEELVKLKDELNDHRMKALALEQVIRAKEVDFAAMSEIFEINYTKREKVVPIKENVNLRIINPSDYRNK